jgi:putative thioredoxin
MTVIDATEADFQTQVIDRSHTTPVVVDFWAPWCGPCKQLTPLLEKLTGDAEGGVVLAKVNTDENQALSQSYGVQGIPAVKAFVDGKVVDEFVGAQNPVVVQRFFAKLIPSEADGLAASGDEDQLRKALELEPGRTDASLSLAALLHERGESDEALALLEKVRGSFRADGMAASLRLREDPELQLDEAFDALAAGKAGEGLEILLDRVRRFPDRRDDLRAIIVGILDELGVDDPLAREVRRKLAAALY